MAYNTEKDSSTVKDLTSNTLEYRSLVIVLRNVSEPPPRIFLSQVYQSGSHALQDWCSQVHVICHMITPAR